MRWHEDDDDYFMLKIPKQRAQSQLAMFALHLSMGNSLYRRTIRLGTIKEYVNAVAAKTACYRNEDIRKDSPTDQTMGKTLSAVYKELQRWEDVPNRREPVTPEMLKRAIQRALDAEPDGLAAALSDLYVMAIFAGLRSGEYVQTEANRRNKRHPAKNCRGQTMAFCIDDFRIECTDGRRLRGKEILTVEVSEIAKMWVKWRTQKNERHGAERLFAQNWDEVYFCFVKATYRVLQRFARLVGVEHTSTPLSVYRTARGRVELVTSEHITKDLRAIAMEVYKLNMDKHEAEIKRWSAHSLRVGACVFLHSQGFSALDIKWILRWESNAYQVYLRNFEGLSKRQNSAFHRLADDDSDQAMPVVQAFNITAASAA